MLARGNENYFIRMNNLAPRVSHLTAPLYLLIDLQRSPTRVVDTLFGWLPVVGNALPLSRPLARPRGR